MLLMDAQALEYADNSFDKVVAMYVVSVAPDPKKVVEEMKRVCKPGGDLFIVNHFSQGRGAMASLERMVSPLSKLVGFRPSFPLDDFLEMADLDDDSERIYVKLEAGDRERFSPQNDPSLVGKTLRVTGTRDVYIDGPSLESTHDLEIVDASAGNDAGECGDDNGVSVATARAASNGTSLDVVGRVIEGVNDPYAMRMGDLTGSATIVVKLESDQRGMYSPANNPGIVDETVSVRGGQRDEYAGEASIESVDSIEIVQCDG